MDILYNKIADMEREIAAIKAHLGLSRGTSGTLTPVTEQHGWVTPTTPSGSSVREQPFAKAARLKVLAYGDAAEVVGKVADSADPNYTWWRLLEGGHIRTDVVHHSLTRPQPVSGLWAAPVAGYTVTNRHGDHGHVGVDLACPMGTAVYSGAAEGVVVKAFVCTKCNPNGDGKGTINNDDYGDGYGSHVIVRYARESLPAAAQVHVKRFVFVLYGHLAAVSADSLSAAARTGLRPHTRLGAVGSTGNSSGAHLHVEIRTHDDPNANFYQGTAVDPLWMMQV